VQALQEGGEKLRGDDAHEEEAEEDRQQGFGAREED
jgi:hypothetical protein